MLRGRQVPRPDLRLHELVLRQASRTPDAVAVRDSRGERLTYRALTERAAGVADRLRRHGVGPDVVVGVSAHRSVELVVALLGTLLAGGAYLPLDPDYPIARLSYLVTTASVGVVLAEDGAADRIRSTGVVVLPLDGQDDAGGPVLPAGVRPGAASLAYVLFTSGSTGRPKGVGIPHAAIVNRLLWMQEEFRLTAADVVLQKTPYTFDVSVWEFFWPLIRGARLFLADPDGHRDPEYLARTIARENVTVVHFVPSMLAMFVEEPELADCGSLRLVVSSGEALQPGLVNRFAGRTGAELYNLYGPTEAAIDVTSWRCAPDADATTVPIGTPIANVVARVLDKRGAPASVGTPGELYLGGVCLASGYLGAPGLTAQRFVADAHSGVPGGRLYRTGDLVRQHPSGHLEFLGRLDDQVKLRGFRVEPGEVAAVLSAHHTLRSAAVAVRTVAGSPKLVAYVLPLPGNPVDPAELRRYVARLLPDYMVPSFFVEIDELPLTANGKLDARALPEPPGGWPSARVDAI